MVRARSSIAFAFCTALAATASAEPTPEDKALALALFQQGHEALTGGHLDEACPKLEESQRLDPGGGTLLNVAACHEAQGRTATAWAEYSDALGVARREGRNDRADYAKARMAALEPELPHVVLEVAPAGPELHVFRDGSEVPRVAWGLPIPLDPGDHVFEARFNATVGSPVRIHVAPREQRRVTLSAPAPPPAPLERPPANPPPPASPAPRSPNPFGFVAVGLFAASALALGVGTYFGVRALDTRGESDAACVGSRCGATAVELNRQAGVFADVSTVSFLAASVTAGAGVLVLLLRPRSATSVPRIGGVVGADGGHVVVQGAF